MHYLDCCPFLERSIVNCKISAVLFVVLSLTVLAMTSQSAELILPLTEAEEAEVCAKNEYFIRKHAYVAKRYRLVKVNADLLRETGRLSIEFFNDERVDVDGTKVDINTVTGAISWFGILDVPDQLTKEDLISRVGSEAAAEAMHKSIYGVNIQANLYETDHRSGANLEATVDPREFLLPSEQRANRYEAARTDKNKFYGVEATFKALKAPTGIVLTPLGMGGPYHILFEVDETKIRDFRLAPDDPENLRRRREYDQFLKSLGDDPSRRAACGRKQPVG